MTQTTLPTKILVASDGSPPSRAAVEMAVDLAKTTRAELHLVHVALVSRYIYPDVLSDAQIDRIKADAQARLDAETAHAKSLGGDIKLSHLRLGSSDAEILNLAEELAVGMIVIGNRTGDAISRILLGDDAESIVRHAHCAVLVVREPGS
ncbi:MAG: universal stress protein [Geminicoccaceae bacterium]